MVVELIAKDKNEKFEYQGKCKLLIDSLSKMLLVESFNEDFKMICLNGNLLHKKLNILFIFAEHAFQDFALVFDDKFKCNKVYGFLLKKGANSGTTEFVKKRFLPPLFEEISKSNQANFKLKEILFKWIRLHTRKEKEEYIQNLKHYNVYDDFYSRNSQRKNDNFQSDVRKIQPKNNNTFVESENKTSKKRCLRSITRSNTIVISPYFEIIKYIKNVNFETRLHVFSSSNQNQFYEYFWCKSRNFYMCGECRTKKNTTYARHIKRNGKDVIQLYGASHVCELKEREKTVEKPNYEVVKFEAKRTIVDRLIIFLDSFREKCYEYKITNKLFYCCGCSIKGHFIGAHICQKDDGTEFVLLKSNNHVCEPRKYNPEKYGEKEIIEAPGFQIFDDIVNGINKSKLVVFASSDKKTCYEYYWNKFKNLFACCGCRIKKKYVFAIVCRHSDESKYIKLYKKKHVCEPYTYDSKKFETTKKEINATNFKIFKYTHNGSIISKLIVFCETNKNLCYEYSWNEIPHLYFCSHCPIKNRVTATTCQQGDSKEYVMLNNAQHVCNLLEFDPEKYKDDFVLDKTMYKISSSVLQNINGKFIIVFTSAEQTFHYKFTYDNAKKFFHCSKCFYSYKTLITATLENEGTQNECVFMSNEKHICEPIEYSELAYGNIITEQKFQFVKRKIHRKIVQHLVIFTNEEKSECYEYCWLDKEKHFLCRACNKYHKIYVYARTFKNDENQDCVELCKLKHQCQPIKFVPEDLTSRRVEMPDFKLWEDELKKKKLTIFKPENKKFGHIYVYRESTKNYVCMKCRNNKKDVTARLCQDDTGQNYLELNKAEHICEWQKV